jgi:hypothetical protein
VRVRSSCGRWPNTIVAVYYMRVNSILTGSLAAVRSRWWVAHHTRLCGRRSRLGPVAATRCVGGATRNACANQVRQTLSTRDCARDDRIAKIRTSQKWSNPRLSNPHAIARVYGSDHRIFSVEAPNERPHYTRLCGLHLVRRHSDGTTASMHGPRHACRRRCARGRDGSGGAAAALPYTAWRPARAHARAMADHQCARPQYRSCA